MTKKVISTELITIITKAVEDKIYGSVEIYFEGGNMTQITQRIINKVKNPNQNQNSPHIKIKISGTKKHHPIGVAFTDKRLESLN